MLTKEDVAAAANEGRVIELKSKQDLDELFDIVDEPAGVDEIPSSGTMVMAYASWCGHCKHLKPEFDDAAKEKGKFPLARIDADAVNVGQVAGYQITGYPTVVIAKDADLQSDNMKFGSKKYADERTADAIVDTIETYFSADAEEDIGGGDLTKEQVLKAVNAGKVLELQSKDDVEALLDIIDEAPGSDEIPSDGAIVMAYASWCGHCKAMKPAFNEVASDLKGKFVVARVDASAHGVRSVGDVDIAGYPTVVLAKDSDAGREGGVKVEEYNGGRSASSMEDAISSTFDVSQLDEAVQAIGDDFDADAVAGASGDACETDFVDDSAFELAAEEQLEL
eukprot:tig00021435_g21400.t1